MNYEQMESVVHSDTDVSSQTTSTEVLHIDLQTRGCLYLCGEAASLCGCCPPLLLQSKGCHVIMEKTLFVMQDSSPVNLQVPYHVHITYNLPRYKLFRDTRVSQYLQICLLVRLNKVAFHHSRNRTTFLAPVHMHTFRMHVNLQLHFHMSDECACCRSMSETQAWVKTTCLRRIPTYLARPGKSVFRAGEGGITPLRRFQAYLAHPGGTALQCGEKQPPGQHLQGRQKELCRLSRHVTNPRLSMT